MAKSSTNGFFTEHCFYCSRPLFTMMRLNFFHLGGRPALREYTALESVLYFHPALKYDFIHLLLSNQEVGSAYESPPALYKCDRIHGARTNAAIIIIHTRQCAICRPCHDRQSRFQYGGLVISAVFILTAPQMSEPNSK